MAKKTDILIIGAGIAGISAGIYLKRSNKDFVILDKDAPGGKLNTVHLIENYPGFEKISGPDLAFALVNQLTSLGTEIEYGNVLTIKKNEEGFLVITDNGDYEVKAVIVATGVKNKKLGIKGENEFLGKGVSYCATCDGNFFKDKIISVYGNTDYVLSEVAYLASLGKKVNLIVPEASANLEEIKSKVSSLANTEIIGNAKLSEVVGDGIVKGVKILKNGEEKLLETAAIFPLFGEESSSNFLSELDVNTNRGFIVVDNKMMSSVEGIFAAGDVQDKFLRQAITAGSDGAIAATSAIAYINKIEAQGGK